MADTRVTVTGVDNGVSNMMQRLRQNAQQTAQQMIQDARSQSKSAKDQLDLINQQIRALEKKGQITQAARQAELKSELGAGRITKEEYQKQQAGVTAEGREQKIHTTLLRELIETTKMVARQEIVSDQKNVERQLDQTRSYRQSEQGVKDEDVMEVFKQDVQEEMLPDEEERNRRMNVNQIGPLLQQRNEVYALAQLSRMIPVVGQTLNSLYQKALGQAEQTEAARGRVQAIVQPNVGFMGGGAAAYGFDMSQFMGQFLEPTVRAVGGMTSVAQSSEIAMQVLQAEKGLGINRSMMLERARLMRGIDEGGLDPAQAIQAMGRAMSTSGVMDPNNANFVMMGEYLQIQNQLTSQQIQKFDDLNQNVNAVAISQFAGLGGSFENPQVLGNIMRGVNDALASPATPYAQAMQFTALSRLRPGASRFELMEMQEKGLQQPGLMAEMFKMVDNASGGNADLMMEQVKALMPQLSFAQVRRMVEGYQSGQLDLDFQAQAQSIESGTDSKSMKRFMENRASQATGVMERQSAGMNNVFAEGGEKMAIELARFNTGMNLIKGTIDSILDSSTMVVKTVADLTAWFVGGGSSNTPPPNSQGRTNTIPGSQTPQTPQSSDIRLKHNIKHIGLSQSGIPIYQFDYIGRDGTYVGVMAQDLVLLGRQDAVVQDSSGYLKVLYDNIDVEFKAI